MTNILFQPEQQSFLEDLSDDVLTMIVEYVSIPKSRNQRGQHIPSSLLRLGLCSRRFQQIVEPILYREFVELYSWSRPPALRQQNFLCRLLARPDLAKRVRKYTGSGQAYNLNEDDREEDEPYGLDMSALTVEDWTRVRAAIQLLEPDGRRTSLWNVEDGSWEAMTTLVLSLLPNLEELTFYEWPPYGDELPSLMAFLTRSTDCQKRCQEELTQTSPSTLACLRSASLIWGDDKGGMHLEALFDYMKLKSLRSISARRIESCSGLSSDDDALWDSENTSPERLKDLDFSHILDISLLWSAITDDRFAFLIRRCPNLQRLEYEYAGEIAAADFEAPKYRLALMPVMSTLQELVMIEGDSNGILRGYPFGSFAPFTALRSIETSQDLILGNVDSTNLPSHFGQFAPLFPKTMTLITALPQTIERLILRNCNASLTPALFELFNHKAVFPLLKYLEITWVQNNVRGNYSMPSSHPAGSASELAKLIDRCKEANIELKMIGADLPDRICLPDSLNPVAGQPIGRHFVVKYPYDGWEEMCEKYDCNPATGRRIPISTYRSY